MSSAALVIALLALAGGNEPIVLPPISSDPLAPRTVVTPFLHTGDPAPGIPNATITWLGPPHIDGAGNVLIWGFFRRNGEPFSHLAEWYGGAGTLQVIAYEGMQAPDLPAGVVYDYISDARLSENGWIGITSFLTGPGIIQGFNDLANFAGPPGDIRKVLQGGDPAPGLEPGTIIDVIEGFGLTPDLSDDGTQLVVAWLSGPGINGTNDKVIWIGPRDDLQLIWREGMEAPGTNGARFDFADDVKFNDAGQIAFMGGLVHQGGIDYSNDRGVWAGGGETLQLLARTGDQPIGIPPGVFYYLGFNHTGLNSFGEAAFYGLLAGQGVTPENDSALWVYSSVQPRLVGREGDLVPEIGQGVEIDYIGTGVISASRDILYQVKYRGPGIDDSNAYAMYFGAFSTPEQSLRDGDQAPHFPVGTSLSLVGAIPPLAALTDWGDVIGPTEIAGEAVTGQDRIVIWFRDRIRDDWFPLLRSGGVLGERVMSIPTLTDLLSAYWNKTGGSDGGRQSFNDAGQLAIRLEFTDGTHGIFLLQLAWPGDGDGDGDVDFLDFGTLQTCFGSLDFANCVRFDFDEDDDVDLFDYQRFLEAVTNPQ